MQPIFYFFFLFLNLSSNCPLKFLIVPSFKAKWYLCNHPNFARIKMSLPKIMAGSDDDVGVICIYYNTDRVCSQGKVCRTSRSCNMGFDRVVQELIGFK